MPSQQPQFVNNEIYHAILRGVGDSVIFKDLDDHYRGIFSIYEFNNTRPSEIRRRRQERQKEKSCGDLISASARDLMVEILAFCFMPNHIHLLLRQIRDNSISEFMRKLGAGYAGYFNRKYDRKGHLFQKFRAIHIVDTEQLEAVFTYIHTNPISFIEPGWKEKGIANPVEVIKFLEKYKWSSYLDYLGKRNFPSITERGFLLKIMGGVDGCKEFIKNWVGHKGGINKNKRR